MKEYYFTEYIDHIKFTFKRVNKATARRAYNNGLRILVCPCKLRPGYPWYPEVNASGKSGVNFDKLIAACEFYNNNETGKYSSFYIPVVQNIGMPESYDYLWMNQE